MSHDFSPNPGKWLTLGIVGLAISLIGFFVDTQIAAWSYLIGLIFVTSIAIGMLFLVMIHHIFDAYWSVIVRRQAEHYLSALPYLGILFIPLFGLTYLKDQGLIWLWMDQGASLHGHGTVASDILYQKKTWWLSEVFSGFGRYSASPYGSTSLVPSEEIRFPRTRTDRLITRIQAASTLQRV